MLPIFKRAALSVPRTIDPYDPPPRAPSDAVNVNHRINIFGFPHANRYLKVNKSLCTWVGPRLNVAFIFSKVFARYTMH